MVSTVATRKKNKEVGLSEKVLRRIKPEELHSLITHPTKELLMFLHSFMPMGEMIDTPHIKLFKTKDYNFIYNKVDGFFARWGAKFEDDPQWSPFGPEIADIEISSGECSGRCPFCYKSNGENGGKAQNMTLDQFKQLFSKLPKTVGQIAFGICDVTTNPDFFSIMEYARSKGVVPNYTCNGHYVTDEVAQMTAKLCGAVAVSLVDKDLSYDAIKKFTDAGMTQVNIHYMLSMETYERAFKIAEDISSDPRLAKMKAIVFLQYKHKNPKSPFHSMVSHENYKKLTEYCQKLGVKFGFDSCSANLFLESVKDNPQIEMFKTVAEPCESSCMSSYINWEGKFYPCSFCENVPGWTEGIDVLNCTDFMKDVWLSDKVKTFREKLLANNRNCPIYDI